jgi:subtilisin family serine protease
MKKISLFAIALLTSFAGHTQTLQSWMSPEIAGAWSAGYKGQNLTITVVDQFKSGSRFGGNFGTGYKTLRHGDWTLMEASMVAPSATFKTKDFGSTGTSVTLYSGLNVLNLSYGMYAPAGYATVNFGAQEKSIINYAQNGRAVISKAAGNDAVVVGGMNASGNVDYLNKSLIGAQSAIFVGSLSSNGTTTNQATMASYSNTAGSNTTVQNQFLVVGVEGAKTGLYGTSFAAPIVTGYAAILGSKFTTATPTLIVNQLLNTARIDTVKNYSASVYGRGEASIKNALAPDKIN